MAFMDNSQFNIGGNIVIMGRTCLGLIYWILLCDMARMRRDVPDVMFVGIFVLVEVLSSFLGYIAVPLAMSSLGLSLQNQSGPLVGAVAFLLIITAILFFNRPQADALSGRGGGEPAGQGECHPGDRLDASKAAGASAIAADGSERRRSLYDACHLTEREAEVAELLAAGNSQKRIAEDLQVSIGTVQSHVKNIYRKLDVHSRQEFIDELNGGR